MARTATRDSDFDAIVEDVLAKSVVVAPSDPNGGGRLPLRQKDQPSKKRADKENYMAVFDRNAEESDDQLDEWEKDTDEATGSNLLATDEERVEDPDDYEDSRGAEVYDALTDEEGKDEKVSGTKKRRLRKSHRDEEDDEDGETGDDDDLDESPTPRKPKGKSTMKKAGSAEGDEEDDGEGAPDAYGEEPEDEEDEEDEGEARSPKSPLSPSKRRREVKKALGKDNTDLYDGSELVKALVDSIFDFRDETAEAVKALRTENRRLRKAIDDLREETHGDLRHMTKSLASGIVRATQGNYGGDDEDAPIRKGFGAPVAARPKYSAARGFDWPKAMDILEKAMESDPDSVDSRDLIALENDHSPQNLTPSGIEILRKANVIA